MRKVTRNLVLFLILMIAASLFSGCNYMKNRANDAMDIIDIGVLVNPHLKPQGGLYIDFFTVTPIGYSNVHAKAIGIGGRHAGVMDVTDEKWGRLFTGSKRNGFDEFNPNDPHQARSDQQNEKDFPRFNTGLVLQPDAPNLPPGLGYSCDNVLMLGWVGLYKNCRPQEIFDFLLGWTTLDISQDDLCGKEEKPNS